MELIFDKWRIVEIEGYPPDDEWCIAVWRDRNDNVDIFVGGYDEERKIFYANFGLGGAVLDQEHVFAWTLLNEHHWQTIKDRRAVIDEEVERIVKNIRETVTIALDEEVAHQFNTICAEAGVTPNEAANEFAKAVIQNPNYLAQLVAEERKRDGTAADEPPRVASYHGEDCPASNADYHACDGCGFALECFPEYAPGFEKIKEGMATPLSECIPESEVDF